MNTNKSGYRITFITAFVMILIAIAASPKALAQTAIPPIPTPMPTLTPTPHPTSTPDPIVALQSAVATQQVEIETLKRDLQYEVRDLRWWLIAAGILVTIAGITTYRSIGEEIRKRIRVLVNSYYYDSNIANLKIHICSERKLEQLENLLKSHGLYNFSWYKSLDDAGRKLYNGITIVLIENDDEEKAFLKYIDIHYGEIKALPPNWLSSILRLKRGADSSTRRGALKPAKAGFILYAPGGRRITPGTIEKYPTTAIANTIWNLVSTVIVIGKNIVPTPPPPPDEENL